MTLQVGRSKRSVSDSGTVSPLLSPTYVWDMFFSKSLIISFIELGITGREKSQIHFAIHIKWLRS